MAEASILCRRVSSFRRYKIPIDCLLTDMPKALGKTVSMVGKTFVPDITNNSHFKCADKWSRLFINNLFLFARITLLSGREQCHRDPHKTTPSASYKGKKLKRFFKPSEKSVSTSQKLGCAPHNQLGLLCFHG